MPRISLKAARMKFIHTADWRIGEPFAGIGDAHKRWLVQQERIEAIKRIGREEVKR